jgi:hypothetical protein
MDIDLDKKSTHQKEEQDNLIKKILEIEPETTHGK